jgi:DNA-binding HxlR family transcriptional regulator
VSTITQQLCNLHDTAQRLLTWCSAVSWRYYRVEWLLTPSEQSFICIMERLQSCWEIFVHQVSNRSAVSWRYYRVEWLLTPSEQSFSCIMEKLESWVINNTEWAIVQLYHGEITELMSDCWHQMSNRSAVSWRDYRVEWLLTPSEQSFSCIMERLQSWVINTNWCQQSLINSVISPWYS